MRGLVPTIIERWNQGAAVGYDIYSRLLKDRIIFVGGYEGAVTTVLPTSLLPSFSTSKPKTLKKTSTFISTRPAEW